MLYCCYITSNITFEVITLYNYRQEQMKSFIEKQNVVTIKQLCQLFPDVSLMTIHRDLDLLEVTGAAVKFRGGARR